MFIRFSGQNNNLSVAVYALHIQGLSDDWPVTMDTKNVAHHGAKTAVCGKRNQRGQIARNVAKLLEKVPKFKINGKTGVGKENMNLFFKICLDSQRIALKPFFSSLILNNSSKSTIDVLFITAPLEVTQALITPFCRCTDLLSSI